LKQGIHEIEEKSEGVTSVQKSESSDDEDGDESGGTSSHESDYFTDDY
jgi:hypothetical protein